MRLLPRRLPSQRPRRPAMKPAVLAASGLLASSFVAALPAQAQGLPDMACPAKTYQATLAPGVPATITGRLCSRGSAAGKALIIAEPGATYSSAYFNWPQDQAHYSFAWAATLAGFAVLVLDEPSTPPQDGPDYLPAADLTIPNDAAALHQVIAAQTSKRIILIGHSVGSYVSLTENATWHDPAVAGLILTAALSQENPAGVAQVTASAYPAQLDPKFAADNLPDGYLTTQPGTRGSDFYAAGDADPAVIAEDEMLKATTTGQTLAGIPDAEAPALSQAVRVPVMLQVGQDDILNCGPGLSCADPAAIEAREAGDWNVRVTAFVLPGSGHDLTTALNGPLATAAALAWALPLAR